MTEPRFDGKTIVITGGARGLGLTMGHRFGQAGARVILTDIRQDEAAAGVSAWRGEGIDVELCALDVREPEQSVALVERLVADYGGIDVWINNAGVSRLAPAETISRTDWDDSLAVMVSGTFFCSQAVGRHMLDRGRGVIVNIASVSGYVTSAGRAAYSTAKAAVVMLTQELGVEWAPRGVRVVGIAPSVVMTDMVRKDIEDGELTIADCERRTPLRRFGTADEVADAVLFLAGDEASYITAETMRVDGGWLAYQLF